MHIKPLETLIDGVAVHEAGQPGGGGGSGRRGRAVAEVGDALFLLPPEDMRTPHVWVSGPEGSRGIAVATTVLPIMPARQLQRDVGGIGTPSIKSASDPETRCRQLDRVCFEKKVR